MFTLFVSEPGPALIQKFGSLVLMAKFWHRFKFLTLQSVLKTKSGGIHAHFFYIFLQSLMHHVGIFVLHLPNKNAK